MKKIIFDMIFNWQATNYSYIIKAFRTLNKIIFTVANCCKTFFFEAILSNGNRTALEWEHKNWVHNGIYCLLWKKVRLHFIKMSALWCSILRQMLYIGEKASIKSHSYFYISMITIKSQLFFLSESCDQKSALIYLFWSEFCSHFWKIE